MCIHIYIYTYNVFLALDIAASSPSTHLTRYQILQILFAGDLWPAPAGRPGHINLVDNNIDIL